MDPLGEYLGTVTWKYAGQDSEAKAELTRRISEAGRRLQMITYSDLVRGIRFRIPSINSGQPYEIDTADWTGFDRAMIGDFLGAISAESYAAGGFLASDGTRGK